MSLRGWLWAMVRGRVPRATAAPAAKPGPWQPTHRHRKGGLYRVLAQGVLEADRSDVVIYDDADGTVWVRAAGEFYDGRFTPLDATTTQGRGDGPGAAQGERERDVVWHG